MWVLWRAVSWRWPYSASGLSCDLGTLWVEACVNVIHHHQSLVWSVCHSWSDCEMRSGLCFTPCLFMICGSTRRKPCSAVHRSQIFFFMFLLTPPWWERYFYHLYSLYCVHFRLAAVPPLPLHPTASTQHLPPGQMEWTGVLQGCRTVALTQSLQTYSQPHSPSPWLPTVPQRVL